MSNAGRVDFCFTQANTLPPNYAACEFSILLSMTGSLKDRFKLSGL